MKVLKQGNVVDRSGWFDTLSCTGCGAELEFNAKDVKQENAHDDVRDHSEHRDAYMYIVCPECGDRHTVVLPEFRKNT